MILPSEIRFADKNLEAKFYGLREGDNNEMELFKSIDKILDHLEINAFSGIQISKKRIPKKYISDYGIKNLWKINLPKGRRLLYSILNTETFVVSLILEWMNHKEYERRFNY